MYQYLGATDIAMYGLFNTIGMYMLYLFNILSLKRKSKVLGTHTQTIVDYFSTKQKSKILACPILWALLEMIPISYIQLSLPYNGWFGNLVGTGFNYYGLMFISPIFLMIIFYLLAVNPIKQMDLLTPGYPLCLVFVKIACFGQGCCQGIEWEHGLYNYSSQLYEFPVQLVECGLALILFIFLLFWRNKAKEGTMFPTYIILYSATRFFSEFLRHEEDVLWIFNTYQILCVIGVIVGIIELKIVKKYGDKIGKFFTDMPKHVKKLADFLYGIKVSIQLKRKENK